MERTLYVFLYHCRGPPRNTKACFLYNANDLPWRVREMAALNNHLPLPQAPEGGYGSTGSTHVDLDPNSSESGYPQAAFSPQKRTVPKWQRLLSLHRLDTSGYTVRIFGTGAQRSICTRATTTLKHGASLLGCASSLTEVT
jgi:hypothetical protein